MLATLPEDKKLWPETWLVSARWYYAPLGFLLGIIGREESAHLVAVPILVVVFFIVL